MQAIEERERVCVWDTEGEHLCYAGVKEPNCGPGQAWKEWINIERTRFYMSSCCLILFSKGKSG